MSIGLKVKSTVKRLVVEKSISLELVQIETQGFTSWAVYGPDHFGQMQYWTQPDEASARSFFDRLRAVLAKEAEAE